MTDAELPDDVGDGHPDTSEGMDRVRPTGIDPLVEGALSDSTGLHALVDKSRERVSAGQARATELLEKYQDHPVLDVGLRMYQRDRESAGTIVGCALAAADVAVVPDLGPDHLRGDGGAACDRERLRQRERADAAGDLHGAAR